MPDRSPRRHRRYPLFYTVAPILGLACALALIGAFSLSSDGGGDRTPDHATTTEAASAIGEKPPEIEDEVFDDNFSDEESGWKTAAAPVWDASYRDRKYELHVLPTSARTAVDAPVDDVPESQLIEVKVEASEGDGGEAGVYCHGQAGGFAFLLREDGRARIAKLDGSQVKDLTTGTVPDLRNNDNRIQAACLDGSSGVQLGMWVNGNLVASTSAAAPDGEIEPSGLIVIRTEGATGHPEAKFDDFALCSV